MTSLQVKNRAPAPIQITAEQLLREANDRGLEEQPKAPKQFITDVEELKLYQQNKRKDFEDQLRRQRQKIGLWCKYGLWEALQKEFERARSVFERALQVDYRNQVIWLKYAEMEMKNKFINHARNIWERAVTLLPRVDVFWFKYTYMEEMIGAIDEARALFERWMKWEPIDHCWYAYIKFELRQNNIENARAIYEQYVSIYPTSKAFIKYSKFEVKLGNYDLARKIYERSLVDVHPYERSIDLYISFAVFEEKNKEYERCRSIYTYLLEILTQAGSASTSSDELTNFVKNLSKEEINSYIHLVKSNLLSFEKKYGHKDSIEAVILNRRRSYYEELLNVNKYNYDAWFDYISLEENYLKELLADTTTDDKVIEKQKNILCKVYDRAINSKPLINEKKYWKRYIYLWINFFIFEELVDCNIEKTRELYMKCLQIIPHKSFTFGKIWLMAAKFELRQKELSSARKILGKGIGLTGKENIFKGYIDLELQLGEIDRCRTLYIKYIEIMPYNCMAWKSYAQLETNLGEIGRARAIYEIAVTQTELDMPELIWKSYIDLEISEREFDNVRSLYKRLLEKSSHVKVFISFAQFESELLNDDDNHNLLILRNIRNIFEEGYNSLKSKGLKEERIILLESWRDIELKAPKHLSMVDDIEKKFPRKIKMNKPKTSDIETPEQFEEYYEYVFPDEDSTMVGLKLLENAMKWKQAASSIGASEKETDDDGVNFEGIFQNNDILRKRKRAFDDNEINIEC